MQRIESPPARYPQAISGLCSTIECTEAANVWLGLSPAPKNTTMRCSIFSRMLGISRIGSRRIPRCRLLCVRTSKPMSHGNHSCAQPQTSQMVPNILNSTHLVCRLLLEKKNILQQAPTTANRSLRHPTSHRSLHLAHQPHYTQLLN